MPAGSQPLHTESLPEPDDSAQQSPEALDGPTFREVYLNSFVSAFGDDLETFRSNSSGRGAVQTGLLLQCIEASMETFSDALRAACLQHVRPQAGRCSKSCFLALRYRR